jgi:hypothetical protein
LEEHGKTLQTAITKAVESSKEAAGSKNVQAVKELDAIAEEIGELNGDVNGVKSAAESLLRHDEYHRFSNVRFPEKGIYSGEILGVAEYNGYAAVLQDGPTKRIETGRRDMYGRPEVSAYHVVWAHEIRPEQAPEMEKLVGHIATIAADGEGDIELTDVRGKKQEWERSRGKGFSR